MCDDTIWMSLEGEDLRAWSGAVEKPLHDLEVFVSHANAALTPKARLNLARLIVDDG